MALSEKRNSHPQRSYAGQSAYMRGLSKIPYAPVFPKFHIDFGKATASPLRLYRVQNLTVSKIRYHTFLELNCI
jgi:hypothetical protein